MALNKFPLKNLRRVLQSVGIGLFLFLISATTALGCICGKSSTCEKFNYYDAVFIGKAIRIEKETKEAWETESTVFEVQETFYGDRVRTIIVQNKSGFSCNAEFDVGETYLVFAKGDAKEGFGTSFCSGNLPINYAKTEIAELRVMSKAKGDGKLQGSVLSQYEGKGTRDDRVPLKDLLLNIVETSTKRRYSTRTNADGRYLMAVPPGKYIVTPVTPAKAVLTYQNEPDVQSVRSGGCSEGFFVFSNKNQIAGRVVDSAGRPAPYVRVELVSIDKQSSYLGGMSDKSNSNGEFVIDQIPIGKYTLSVNYNNNPHPEHPFPTTFYPNGSDRSAAEVFEIDSGTMIDGLIWKLPEPLAKQAIIGSVVFADGTPVVGAKIELFDMAFPGFYAGCHSIESKPTKEEELSPVRSVSMSFSGPTCGLKSDSTGRFQLSIYKERTYRLSASITETIDGKRVEYEAESEAFLLSDQPHSMKLIIIKTPR